VWYGRSGTTRRTRHGRSSIRSEKLLTQRILQAATQLGALGAGEASLPLILSALCDPTRNATDIARVIAHEPGIAARVLRVANSAYYGAAGTVATLERAFVLLGVDAVRGIAAAACLDRAVLRSLKSAPIDLREMLRHSIATAIGAEAIARARHRLLASEAFIAGLLHDFGVTLQLQVDAEAFKAVVDSMQAAPDLSVREREQRHGCVSHEHCAAVVFTEWRLPPNLVAAIAHHHRPEDAPAAARAVAACVALGNQLAISLGLGYALEPGPARPPDDATLAEAGIDLERYEATRAGLLAHVDEYARTLT
jgi:HD-like signal output (HDOD) protein